MSGVRGLALRTSFHTASTCEHTRQWVSVMEARHVMWVYARKYMYRVGPHDDRVSLSDGKTVRPTLFGDDGLFGVYLLCRGSFLKVRTHEKVEEEGKKRLLCRINRRQDMAVDQYCSLNHWAAAKGGILTNIYMVLTWSAISAPVVCMQLVGSDEAARAIAWLRTDWL